MCRAHPIVFIKDRDTAKNANPSVSHARASLPYLFELRSSLIEGAGLGVFTKVQVPANVVLGPYKGERISDPSKADRSGYSWQIRGTGRNGCAPVYVDANDETQSNWLRFINCSRVEQEQNLVAWQYKGEVYYRTYKSIPPRTELLGERKSTATVSCPSCDKTFASVLFLEYHKIRAHKDTAKRL